MSNPLTYESKLKWLCVSFVLSLIICFKFSILKTIKEYQKYKYNYTSNQENSEQKTHLSILQAKNIQLTNIFRKFQLDTAQIEKSLLSFTSAYCNENALLLKEYRPFSLSKNDSINVLTRTITVEGPFISCVKFIKALETNAKVGRVSSVDFKSFVDGQDKKIKLNCKIFVQNLLIKYAEPN
jgi:hypothetical protein